MKSPSLHIREAIPSDAKDLLALKMNYLRTTQTIPLYIEEYANDRQAEAELILRYQKQANSLLLLTYSDDQLVGNIDITGNQRQKLQHTAVVGMGVHTAHHNKGIGAALLQQTIHWAKTNSILKILWLEVYSSNCSGIALYTKLGFTKCGTIPKFFNESSGYVDKHTMYLMV
ncbi:GNAT family N-acetyltransferase [Aquimarina intermedia]|uniref:Putative acetyltransferase n=1 Tax=Aquimarina intermedia TaxID=350814 RepID=A0A5S5CA11_9FLAO|nr:GNAT family N-acetyltransferase [Aquimarina intermedia]TYP76251.1 putative acetyltransferase [Aquimarina intermedia]